MGSPKPCPRSRACVPAAGTASALARALARAWRDLVGDWQSPSSCLAHETQANVSCVSSQRNRVIVSARAVASSYCGRVYHLIVLCAPVMAWGTAAGGPPPVRKHANMVQKRDRPRFGSVRSGSPARSPRPWHAHLLHTMQGCGSSTWAVACSITLLIIVAHVVEMLLGASLSPHPPFAVSVARFLFHFIPAYIVR